MFLSVVLCLLLGATSTLSFTTTPSPLTALSKSTKTPTELALTEVEIPDEAMFARGEFLFWFFGASGGGGIGLSTLPKQFKRYQEAQKLRGVGPTNGGPTLGLPAALFGYPEDVCVADVQKIIQNPLSVKDIVKKYPEPPGGDYLAVNAGYINIRAFKQANANANPLAIQVVFDSFSQANDNVQPKVAQETLDLYKSGDLEALKSRLFVSKGATLAAASFLLFLLGLAGAVSFSDLYQGWFPDWPGGTNFPFSMFTEANGSPFNIPDYWI